MEKSNRRYDLDWLRVIAFYILIFYHVGMIFVPWEFHIKNNITAEWFETWMAFLSQWRLPLLFMISGAVVFHSLGKRSGKIFLKERFIRLFIPLLFGMLIIVPPQIYFERISNGVQFDNYFQFWVTVFNFVPYPLGGSVSWHHLWYVLYILIYSIIALPLFLFLKSERSANFRKKIEAVISRKSNLIYLIAIPLLIFYYTLAPIFPTTHDLINDWYNHSISFSFFILGFFISSIESFSELLAAKRKLSLAIAAIPASILILFVWGPTFEIFNEEAEWFFILYGLLKWTFIISFLFAIFGYAKALLNKSSRVLSYANESVYPLYILHQTVEIFFGYYIIQLELPLMIKFFALVVLTFGVSFLLYELIVKRVSFLRIFFGLKMKRKFFLLKEPSLNTNTLIMKGNESYEN